MYPAHPPVKGHSSLFFEQMMALTKPDSARTLVGVVGAHLVLVLLLFYSVNTLLPQFEDSQGKAGDTSALTMVQLVRSDRSVAEIKKLQQPQVEQKKAPQERKVEQVVAAKSPVMTVKESTATVVSGDQVPGKPSTEHKESSETSALNGVAQQDKPAGAPPAAAANSDSGKSTAGEGAGAVQRPSALNRRVNYPTRARSMGIEGKVKVIFDVTASGTVVNVRIQEEEPEGVFGSALEKDMLRWRYQTQESMNNLKATVIYTMDGGIKLE
jgi:protein TonB